MPIGVRVKLSAMMFLQFMMFAVFWVPFAGYLSNTLGFTVANVTMIMSTMAFGCMLSPIVGMIVDRHFSSQKVLAVLNLFSGILLVLAASQTEAKIMFAFLLIAMLCYMPTWGLTSSIAMTHSPTEQFPQIRAFGSFGWVSAAIFSLGAKYIFGIGNFDSTALPLYCGAIVSVVAAVLALTIPHTPPPSKGEPSSVIDALGLRAASLLKKPDFLVFILISTLVMTPFMIYFNLNSMFLNDMGFKQITFTMNLGQFGEIFFMLLITIALARMGVKWAMTMGLGAMVVRYAAFWLGSVHDITAMYYVGIIIHGIIFGFFFVGGQIYVDKRAQVKIRGQAQGLLFLITFGIGTLLSMQLNNALINANTTTGLKVPAGFKFSENQVVSPKMLSLNGAGFSDVRLYNRVLNDTEISVLAADELKAKNIRAEAEGDPNRTIGLETGIVAKGGLENIIGKGIAKQFSFDAVLALPKDTADSADDILDGTIFSAGSGENVLAIGVEQNVVYFQAGDNRFDALRIVLPRALEEETHMRITATFDGEEFKFYTDGGVFAMRDWKPIWKITTIVSIILLIAFVVLFHYKEDKDETGEEDTEAVEIAEDTVEV